MPIYSKIPDRALVGVGITSAVLAVLGVWYNSTTLFADYSAVLVDLEKENDLSNFYAVFYTMSGICIAFHLSLLLSGIQLIRKKTNWVFVLSAIVITEIVYLLIVGQLWKNSVYGTSVAAATGVSSGGLMFQAFALFPIWAPATALWARHKKQHMQTKLSSNSVFEADAVKQRRPSGSVRAPRRSTRR